VLARGKMFAAATTVPAPAAPAAPAAVAATLLIGENIQHFWLARIFIDILCS
jgi:hypothetical protein